MNPARRHWLQRLALLGPAGHGGARRPKGELRAWRGAWALTFLSAGSTLWLVAAVLWPSTWNDLSACYADAGSAWLMACAAVEALLALMPAAGSKASPPVGLS